MEKVFSAKMCVGAKLCLLAALFYLLLSSPVFATKTMVIDHIGFDASVELTEGPNYWRLTNDLTAVDIFTPPSGKDTLYNPLDLSEQRIKFATISLEYWKEQGSQWKSIALIA